MKSGPDTTVDEHNLHVQIANLRRTLNDGCGNGRDLAPVSRRGYQFVSLVTLVGRENFLSAPFIADEGPDANTPPNAVALVGAQARGLFRILMGDYIDTTSYKRSVLV